MHFLKYLTLSFLLVFASLTPAAAQSLFNTSSGSTDKEVTLPSPLTTEAANALVSRLSDSEVRGLLLDQLNAQSVVVDESAEINDFLYHATQGSLENVKLAFERLPVLFSHQAKAFKNFYKFVGPTGLVKTFAFLGLVMLGGLLVELIFRRVTRSWLILPKSIDEVQSLRQTITVLVKRLTSEILAVLVFVMAAQATAALFVPKYYMPFIGLVGPMLVALPRLSLALARFLMAPKNPAFRIVNASDKVAKAMVFHQFWFALLIGFGLVIIPFNIANGASIEITRIGFWLNASVHIYAAIIFWRYREALVLMMRGAEPNVSPMEDRVARAFPYFAILAAIGTWWVVNIVISYGAFGLLGGAPHYKTLFLLVFAPAMDTVIRAMVRHLAPAMTGEGPIAERAYRSAKDSYVRIGRVVVFGIVILLIASFWGLNPNTIASAGVGPQLAAHLIEFLIIMAIGYLIYELVSLYFNRQLAAEHTAAGHMPDEEAVGGDGGGAGGSRLSTVLPLILLVSQTTIVVVFVLLGLGNIGVDTTPLLAGAGIAGLAIGFGAQKLVTDVVSGIFFLVDDAFRTGEYVEVDGTMGTVEKISIRSMQLRHHKGPIHTLPYGEIPKITNYSRDWVIMKLRFTVAFDTDPNKVKKIFKKIGQEMLELEEFKNDFLQPFKSQGMLQIDDVGMVFRGKFMAKPGTQFTIRKEIFNRVNAAFAENGIDFARREVRVALPSMENKDLSHEDKATIAAAATQAAQDPNGEGEKGGKKDDR